MRIVLTGADGFIGSTIGRALRAGGHEVLGAVFGRAPGDGELGLDVTRAADFERLPAAGVDAIVHNAGLVGAGIPRRRMFAVNAGGTRNALAWARRAGVGHFVQVSSIGVHGLRSMGEGRDESTPRARFAGVAYQRSKAAAEAAVLRSGLPASALRFPAVIGRGDTVITEAIASRLDSGRMVRCGGGDPTLSLLDVEHVGPVLERLLAHGPTGAALNCTSHCVTWNELIRLYAEALGVPPTQRRRPLASILAHLSDHDFLFIATSSRFGAHFPSDRLDALLGPPAPRPLPEVVREAVAAWRGA